MTDKELLELAAKVKYFPETGSMIWLPRDLSEKDARRWNKRYADKECGTLDDHGYRRILYRPNKNKILRIRVHRLAWFIYYGTLPIGEVDHINQNKLDNSISNLRDVPKNVNLRNCKKFSNNTSGITGVMWHKQHNKWYACVTVDGVKNFLGLFNDLCEAEKVVSEFRKENLFSDLHGK